MSSILVIMFLAIWRVSVHRGSSSEVFLGKGVQKLYRSNPPEVFLGKGVLKICQSNPPEVLLRKTVLKTFSKRTREFTRQLRLKSHFGMGVLPQICCIFSEHLFLSTPLEGSFWAQDWFTTNKMGLEICYNRLCKQDELSHELLNGS